MNKIKGKYIVNLFCVFIIAIKSAIGQQKSIMNIGFAINPKIGIYISGGNDGGITNGIELNLLKNKTIYSIDYYRFEEFVIIGPSPSEYYNQMAIMIGKYKENSIFRFQYQTGIAIFSGQKRTEFLSTGFLSDTYKSENFLTAGLTTKLGFKIVPLKFLSIGMDLQTNINFKKTVYMPVISIEIGKVKY